MKPVRVDERRIRTADGTEVAYHVVGQGAPVLLANGLGGSWHAWRHQIAYLSDRYRFVSWDYRGLYRSGRPREPAALTVAHHVDDAFAVLEAEKIERLAVLGWSMGVQVALEMFRQQPDRIAALVLMNGVAGRPWETVLDFGPMKHLVPYALRLARVAPGLASAITHRVVQWPETTAWVKRIGLASRTLDDELFQQLAGSFSEIDMGVYMHTLELLGGHDAYDVLPDVDVPTLVIAGDRDLMTPRSAAERMVRAIPGADLMIVPGGTHYVAVEYPELVSLRIEKFFRERGYAGGAVVPEGQRP